MNCSFNIRYKPRTTRAFTKSDLTVYDSAGNTALNALTVYGKSEVVDGAITSAGEGYAVVRLADLTWGYQSSQKRFFAEMSNSKQPTDINALANIFTNKYKLITFNELVNNLEQNKAIAGNQTGTTSAITIRDTDYTAVSDFVTSLGDATLCYELADPTQGNCIAIKTDNGSGINGTMAVFETGTPLRATLDGTTRDEMHYNGITGEVITRCEIVNDEVVPLATPITTPLTQAENDSLAALRTFTPTTHTQNNAGAEMTVDYTIKVPTI